MGGCVPTPTLSVGSGRATHYHGDITDLLRGLGRGCVEGSLDPGDAWTAALHHGVEAPPAWLRPSEERVGAAEPAAVRIREIRGLPEPYRIVGPRRLLMWCPPDE